MFWKIFLFEIQNRIRRPAVYLYFVAALIFTIFTFATGSLPAGEKEHYNAPYLIALWCAGITMMMMLITSSIMGTPLYRDIEYNTKDYYLTYPITKAGYFWGRFLGSFVCMLFISCAIMFGILIGTKLGPAMGWRSAEHYGPNHLIYYLYPYFTIALPNIIFTSCLFFGLVAITRNVKVIYSGGILLFLGYFISIFFLNHTNNATVITLSDAFGLNGVRLQSNGSTAAQQNTTLLPVSGLYLLNRIIWSALGLVILIYTYLKFNFEKFFSGKRDKAAIDDITTKERRTQILKVKSSFSGTYNRSTLFNLTKIELNNIIRDNYFWIILGSGLVFLGFVFWMGDNFDGVPVFPRSIMFLDTFNSVFLFFIFFIIVFYTGETLHRDRVTRYAFINDSLPPPNWVLNGSKLIALLFMGFCLAFIPLVLGVPIQIIKGFHQFNFSVYFMYIFTIILPRLLEMVMFAYAVHVTINNKFAAHGIAVFLWVALFFLRDSGIFNYNMLLYSYTPWYGVSDMDGLGHMAKPVYWFNIYWLLDGGLLIIVAALFYYRGVTSSFKERLQLVGERFDTKTRLFAAVVFLAFLVVGSYIYYNVNYLNVFLTKSESENRAISYEKKLKPYANLPLPKVTRIKMYADLFPDKQQQFVKAYVTIVNKTNQPISKLLLDGDELTDYSIKINNRAVPFTYPLMYQRGFLNFLRPKQDTADFRLYQFEKILAPGDSAVLEINSSVIYKGFSNGLYGEKLLRNGTFFTGGLPGLGYDDDDEVSSPYVRKESHLPPKKNEDIEQNDPEGISTLKTGKASDLLSFDLTVSTSGDQTAVAQGILQKHWQQNGRNYYHYVQTNPGMYAPLAAVSARYADLHDSVLLNQGHKVDISIFYHPAHKANLGRFMAAYKDGLHYFDNAYGAYPFKNIRLAETSVFSPRMGSSATFDTYAEYFGWNADFNNPNQNDFCYFNTVQQLAQQWWRFQVAPNNTVGSLVIPEGLARYSALVMTEKKYGKNNMKWILQDQLWAYLWIRTRLEEKEHPLIKANQWFEWGGKAGVVLYGLRDLMGEDSLNSALKEFKNAYVFKNKPPFAGTNDLYRYLQKHVPDSLQYYLTDNWQKITLYNNKMVNVTSASTGNKNEYKVTMKINIEKAYIDGKGNDIPAKQMNDYIDIGIFGAETKNKDGRNQTNPLYLKKYKLAAGEHTVTITVKGKPVNAGIDPYNKLIDRMPNDNIKDIGKI
ncbi:MAG: type transport system permease protein [Mucilaginibacter sp.]|nr:type transport system permease protein [Mucilaginibacter sp.]